LPIERSSAFRHDDNRAKATPRHRRNLDSLLCAELTLLVAGQIWHRHIATIRWSPMGRATVRRAKTETGTTHPCGSQMVPVAYYSVVLFQHKYVRNTTSFQYCHSQNFPRESGLFRSL